jgi:glycosyltransferase involved in cell wall biosynthesis
MPLKIASKVDRVDREYFQQVIRPLLDNTLVEYVGEIGDNDKGTFLGGAYALLFPIDWPEPFGLVMIEALACGTPVIAWRRGSVPEVIDDGVTGYITDSIEDAVDAVHKIHRLSRERCRQTFEERFDAERMAADYVEVYRRVIAAR